MRNPEYREEVRRSIIEDDAALAQSPPCLAPVSRAASASPHAGAKERVRAPWVGAYPQDKSVNAASELDQ